MAGNNVEWTSEQMIEKANGWSLAGDVALLNSIKKFSESLLSETELVNANVDNLINNLENVSLRLDLTRNEFQSLRNTQFIENRVYEDDETLENKENKKEEKELSKEEKESAIKESIVKGLKVMEQYFEKIEVAVSDSEEENNKSYILQAKDLYADRPLPYLVGSQDWYKKWHVGLLPSESESESEKEEEVYSSSDSDEGLPKDKNLGSETSSELDFTNRHTGPVANSTFNDSQDRRREIFHSSDESSDQSNSLPVKAPLSNEKFAEQLAAKLGDVISGTSDNLPRVNRNPIKKMNEATKYGNLFSDEPPPLDDLEDTVLPKSAHEGLFSGGRDLFGDSEDDLFVDQSNTISKNINTSGEKPPLFSPPHVKPALKVSKGLFDESDSSSEEDMFDAVAKRKVKIVQPYLQPKVAVPFVDDQPPDISSKSDPVSSKKKPIGGVSIFGENANIFGETSGKPGFENTAKSQITENIESKSIKNIKKSVKKTSLFDESSDEDIIAPQNNNTQSKKPQNQQDIKNLNLFGDAEDTLSPKTQEPFKKSEEKKTLSLFDDDIDQTSEKDNVKILEEKNKKLIPSNNENPYQNVDLFRPTTKEISEKTDNLNKTSTENKKPAKKISLFDDDDDDFLKEEEDIFASVTKKTSLFDKIAAEPKKTGETLFEDTESDTSSKISATKDESKPSKGLFDDLETKNTLESPSTRISEDSSTLGKVASKKKSSKGLFDDLETSISSEDLFGSSKNQGTQQKNDSNKKKSSGGLFEDNSSANTGSKTADIDIKFAEKKEDMFQDSSKDLKGDGSEENDRQQIREKDNLSTVISVEETKQRIKENAAASNESKFGSPKANVKPQGASLFRGSDNNDFVGGSNTEENAVKLVDEISNVLKATKSTNLVENPKQDMRNDRNIKNINVGSEEDNPNINNKLSTDQADNVLRQNKNDLLGKIRKNVGFLDSGNESSSDDDFGFGKKSTENIASAVLEQKTVGSGDASKNYTIPPSIDLFDPTPPPLDWDATSDNSGESDTFSLTDGILNQSNLNQSQARSSLFDEAPPSLDVNESSGIVRDMNVTRVETDDSSFYPYASSSRRFSSDIFGEQQSQDSFFVTKSRTEVSTQPGSSLEQIPENLENMSSKIENLTPSGDLEDFEGSSVFESESKDSDNMDSNTSAMEIKKTQEATPFKQIADDNKNVNISPSKVLDNVRTRASLFEGNRALDKEQSIERDETIEKQRTSPIKTSPGKLQHNLKINVNALMPGAARPKLRADRSASSDEIDKSDRSTLAVGGENLSPPVIRSVALASTKNIDDSDKKGADIEHFESLSQTEVLPSATKDRVRIPIKRRPSSRKARQEAVRKSMTDFGLYQNEEISSLENEQSVESNDISLDSTSEQSSEPEKISQRLTSKDKSRFLKDLRIPDYVPKQETSKKDYSVKVSEEEPKVTGISLVFDEPSAKQEIKKEKVKSPVSEGIFEDLLGEIKNKQSSSEEDKIDIFSSKSIESKKSNNTLSFSITSDKKESKNIFEDSFEDKPNIFKPTSKAGDKSRKPKKDKSIFGDEGSNSSDEDLFSNTNKSVRKDPVSSTEKSVKVEEVSSKKDPMSIFSDKSDSDGEGELFGGKSKVSVVSTTKKIVGETSKKTSIFDDSNDSSEEDLFGSKTSKRSESGDSSGTTGSVFGTKRTESKNVKIASVKKLENKEVTNFDPLSALK